ncbi:MAG TPA: hypothetical protein VN893_25575 [Bryobacteraceae bacterium]|nr:hypothetical protein [Bryobacteraceae bacterium]
MVLADILEWTLMAVAVLVLLTQIVVPLFRSTPFFPLFRRGRKLTQELAAANEEVENAKMERQIRAARQEAARLRKQSGVPEGEPQADRGEQTGAKQNETR